MDKTYTRLYVDVQKQLAATFKERTAERGDTTAEIFRNAIKAYLAETAEN
ncbi:MAG: ribbon-helix-helix protein, CopG family [Oscillospiraceae bacterium]|jgi:metal-responsive CopG/Arc/MetJ family transcriptional regulator|nr:ribbon-helix-helix protein, CopG family [Oscillospiraceae bacterium]